MATYKITLYNKYNWDQSISIENLSESNVKTVKRLFNNDFAPPNGKRVIVQNFLETDFPDTQKDISSTIDLDQISYIEFQKTSEQDPTN